VADALDLLTLDEAKRALNIPLADTTFDTEVASYVTAVSQRLDDLCGPVVKRTITDEVHDGGYEYIFPNHTPVLSVTSVAQYSSGTATTLTAETVGTSTTANYLLIGGGTHESVIRRRSTWSDTSFPAGRSNVVITYVAGRFNDTGSVTPKFKQGAAKMLSLLWKGDQGAGTVTFGAPTELDGIGVVGFAVPRAVTDLLAYEIRPPAVA
jgi:hypothetical protein